MITTPDSIPLLSRGRHRRASRGACLMEFVSLLAGERWTDHPSCTHPLIGTLARLVNDCSTEPERQRIALYGPSLVGLNSDDPRWDGVIARRTILTVLPYVAQRHQRSLAVGLLVCERYLAAIDGRDPRSLSDIGRACLELVPHSHEWAEDYVADQDMHIERFQTRNAPSIVRTAVVAAREAEVLDADALMRSMIDDVIDECRSMLAAPRPVPTASRDSVLV